MVNSKSQLINILALLLISTVVLVVILSASGLFDPGPSGSLIWERALNPMPVGAGSVETRWFNQEVPDAHISVQLTARHHTGEKDSGYGLLLGREENALAVGVSPLGYVAIWTQQGNQHSQPEAYILPWQPWPHVRTGDEPNEILVNLDDEKLSVLVNREKLWEGSALEQPDMAGIIGTSFGEAAVVDLQQIMLFAE